MRHHPSCEGSVHGQKRLQEEEGAGDVFLKAEAGCGWMLAAVVGGVSSPETSISRRMDRGG